VGNTGYAWEQSSGTIGYHHTHGSASLPYKAQDVSEVELAVPALSIVHKHPLHLLFPLEMEVGLHQDVAMRMWDEMEVGLHQDVAMRMWDEMEVGLHQDVAMRMWDEMEVGCPKVLP
jgi:hypothetical protein